MAFKIVSIAVMAVSYVLIILSAQYALSLARKAHGVDLKDVKNEVPGGYLIRGALSLVYYFSIVDWIGGWRLLPWAYLSYPRWLQAAGLVLLVLDVAFFWWIHATIGPDYHGPMKLHDNHRLVTTGPYAFARHPSYIAFPLLHGSLFLITQNLLLLVSGMAMSLYVNGRRVIVEERLLVERFGPEYEEYASRVGRWFPRRRR